MATITVFVDAGMPMAESLQLDTSLIDVRVIRIEETLDACIEKFPKAMQNMAAQAAQQVSHEKEGEAMIDCPSSGWWAHAVDRNLHQ